MSQNASFNLAACANPVACCIGRMGSGEAYDHVGILTETLNVIYASRNSLVWVIMKDCFAPAVMVKCTGSATGHGGTEKITIWWCANAKQLKTKGLTAPEPHKRGKEPIYWLCPWWEQTAEAAAVDSYCLWQSPDNQEPLGPETILLGGILNRDDGAEGGVEVEWQFGEEDQQLFVEAQPSPVKLLPCHAMAQKEWYSLPIKMAGSTSHGVCSSLIVGCWYKERSEWCCGFITAEQADTVTVTKFFPWEDFGNDTLPFQNLAQDLIPGDPNFPAHVLQIEKDRLYDQPFVVVSPSMLLFIREISTDHIYTMTARYDGDELLQLPPPSMQQRLDATKQLFCTASVPSAALQQMIVTKLQEECGLIGAPLHRGVFHMQIPVSIVCTGGFWTELDYTGELCFASDCRERLPMSNLMCTLR